MELPPVLPEKNDFICTRGAVPSSGGLWREYPIGEWRLYCGPQLPLRPLHTKSGELLGYLLGYWLHSASSTLCGPIPPLEPLAADEIDTAAESIHAHTLGRYAMVLRAGSSVRWYPDASGSLAIVYNPELRAVASRPELLTTPATAMDSALGSDLQRLREKTGTWYIAGLCCTARIEVVLPNHRLDTSDWTLRRLWPVGPLPVIPHSRAAAHVARAIAEIRRYLWAVLDRYPVALNLTSGRDTRMLLAIVRPRVSEIVFWTLPRFDADMSVARILGEHFGLSQSFAPHPPRVGWFWKGSVARWDAPSIGRRPTLEPACLLSIGFWSVLAGRAPRTQPSVGAWKPGCRTCRRVCRCPRSWTQPTSSSGLPVPWGLPCMSKRGIAYSRRTQSMVGRFFPSS